MLHKHNLLSSALILVIISSLGGSPVRALEVSQPNNKFGISVVELQDSDLKKAAQLVNSNGGKWGYVTVVIQERDMEKNKWQGIFDDLRRLQLIPIVRLATQPEGGNWKRPNADDADRWVHFLNELNWVEKNRYVVLFNEPNHATEWGGAVDAKNFADVNKAFAKKLKETNPNFFVMMGGIDASAPSQGSAYQDEGAFLSQVFDVISADEFNTLFDGLSSHSYPNPGFAGSPYSSGKGTVRTYDWELNMFKQHGVKDLPVFITETGWNGRALSRDQVAKNFETAYTDVWGPDDRVVAVTPFVLNYQGEPFLQFSWLKPDNTEPYPEYFAVQSLEKKAGQPVFEEKGNLSHDLPQELVAESTFHLHFNLKNDGQAIWRPDDGYALHLDGVDSTQYLISSLNMMQPRDAREFDMFFTTGTLAGKKQTKLILTRGDKKILESKPWSFSVAPLPSLDIHAGFFPKLSTSGENFELQLFDDHEELVFKQKGIEIVRGSGSLAKVESVALGRKYRAVLLQKNYLPVQTFITFKKGENSASFKLMFPLDANGDGNVSFDDVWALIRHPSLLRLWLPF